MVEICDEVIRRPFSFTSSTAVSIDEIRIKEAISTNLFGYIVLHFVNPRTGAAVVKALLVTKEQLNRCLTEFREF